MFKEIAERQIAVVIEAAGHDRSVDEHTDLVTQPVTEAALSPVRRVELRPVELVVLGQKNAVGKLDAARALLPGRGKALFKQTQDLAVSALASAAVPKTKQKRRTGLHNL